MDRRRLKPLVLAAAALALIVLALWPPSPEIEVGDAAAARRYDRKLAELTSSIAVALPAEASLSEAEINARLAELMAANQQAQQARGLTVGLRSLAADARDDAVVVYVDTRLLSIPLTFRARFAKLLDQPLELRSLWLGRLPLVGPFRQLFASRMGKTFRRVEPERTVLQHLTACTHADGELTVSVGGQR